MSVARSLTLLVDIMVTRKATFTEIWDREHETKDLKGGLVR